MKENELSTIWKAFKESNWQSYAALYNTFYDALLNYGYKFTSDKVLIEDAIHDLFVRLWTSREKISNPVSVKNYLFKSLRNILFRKLKRMSKTRIVAVDDYHPGFEINFNTENENRVEDKEMQEMIRNIINKLPARQQEIIFLRFYEGLSYEEIADIMDITVSSAYKLLYKALHKLQQTIGSSLLFYILFVIKPLPKFFL